MVNVKTKNLLRGGVTGPSAKVPMTTAMLGGAAKRQSGNVVMLAQTTSKKKAVVGQPSKVSPKKLFGEDLQSRNLNTIAKNGPKVAGSSKMNYQDQSRNSQMTSNQTLGSSHASTLPGQQS
jgi:hypothetical protein